jgi:hypothetical protein
LDGLAIPVDPNEHQFMFQRGAEAPISRTERVEPTDKFRPIEVALPDPNLQDESPPVVVSHEGPGRTIAGVSLIGIGVVGVGAFALLGSSARDREHQLQDRDCKPHCAQGFVDSVSTRYTLSNISLAVGVASLGAATWVLLSGPSAPKDPAPSAHVDVVAGPRGGTVTLSSSF